MSFRDAASRRARESTGLVNIMAIESGMTADSMRAVQFSRITSGRGPNPIVVVDAAVVSAFRAASLWPRRPNAVGAPDAFDRSRSPSGR
jgi:hypothetical protein